MYEKDYKKEYKLAIKKIKEFNRIVVFRHQRPDGDAFGSQMGMVTWLKDNFPNKEVHFVGENSITYTDVMYPVMETLDDSFFNQDFLAIVCDTGDTKRIDNENWKKAKYVIKFDHHPAVELYGNINIIENEISSCCELITDFMLFFKKKYPISKLAAMYLFSGLATDTGRFQFSSVTPYTYQIASYLTSKGIVPIYDIYQKIYLKDVSSLVFQKFVLNHMVFLEKGIAYYILKDEDLKEIGITDERGKEHLSLMSNIKGIHIWMCITEIKEKGEWRVSIRSSRLDISGVASKYHGGGHMQASGATLYDFEKEFPLLVSDLEALIK